MPSRPYYRGGSEMRLRGRVVQATEDEGAEDEGGQEATGQWGQEEVSSQSTMMVLEILKLSNDYKNGVLQKVTAIEAKVDGVEERHRGSIETHAKEQRDKLDAIALEQRQYLTALEGRLDGKLTGLEGRLDGKLTALEGRIDGKLTALEGTLDAAIKEQRQATKDIDAKLDRYGMLVSGALISTLVAGLGKFVFFS